MASDETFLLQEGSGIDVVQVQAQDLPAAPQGQGQQLREIEHRHVFELGVEPRGLLLPVVQVEGAQRTGDRYHIGTPAQRRADDSIGALGHQFRLVHGLVGRAAFSFVGKNEEQRRLGLHGSAQLLEGTIVRNLHKVGSFIYPGERKQEVMHFFYELYRNPDKRRAKELELCQIFGERLGRDFAGHEILIDIPGFNKTPEVDLKVFYGKEVPSDKSDPLSFDDPEVSRLRDSLLHNFEDQAKVFRIFCIDDPELLPLVQEQVKRYLR